MTDVQVTSDADRIVTITPRGRVDAFGVGALRSEVDGQLGDGAIHFVVDLRQVTFLDSAGMAVLVRLLTGARRNGGDVALVHDGQSDVARVLDLTGFHRVFPTYPDLEGAYARVRT